MEQYKEKLLEILTNHPNHDPYPYSAREEIDMEWFLHFTYSPDHGEKWHVVDGKMIIKRMWYTCFIKANSEKEAKRIAEQHMSEFTASHLIALRPEP